MSKEPLGREYLAIAASDHEVLSAYGARVKKMLTSESPQYLEKQIADIKLLLNQKLVNHFAFEEEHVFPALLAANLGESASRLLSTLPEDHKALLAEVSRLNEMLSDQQLVSQRAGELRKALLEFLRNLETHTSQEDELSHTAGFHAEKK